MQVDISKQEAWKILDAIEAYVKDYNVAKPVSKTLSNVEIKLKKVIHAS